MALELDPTTALAEPSYELAPIRCSVCGRFHGYECISDGMLFIRCHNCKNWIVIMHGDTMDLTSQQVDDILLARTKGHEGQPRPIRPGAASV